MLAPEDLPAKHARVMRIVDPSAPAPPMPMPSLAAPLPQPSSSSSQSNDKVDKFAEDYDSSEDESQPDKSEDDGWNVVASKPKSKSSTHTHIPRHSWLILQNSSPSPFPPRRPRRLPRLLCPCRPRYRRRMRKRRKRRKRRGRPRRQIDNGASRCTEGISSGEADWVVSR